MNLSILCVSLPGEVPLETSNQVALLAAGVAALVTVLGYLANQYASRRTQRRDLFASALAAVRAYQDLPYRIRWRARSDEETRAALGELTYTTLEHMQNFRALLELESRIVAMAYTDLVRETRRLGGPFRQSAWRTPPAQGDEAFDQEDPGYRYENQPELELCLMAMQRELRPYGPLLRRATRRRILSHRRRRAVSSRTSS
ncbi:hypothetical protein [Streptomyces sp. NPDC026673]|uniref:hypothetical protein n=1 Tax=Streptomyces sp. NPDC026673 TaxID=3155724 RepID=UPI0033F4FDF0